MMAGGATVTQTAVTVGGTAVLLLTGRTLRESVVIKNNHATQILYVGNASVTTSDGMPVAAGQSITLEVVGTLYGIASGAGTDVRVLESY